MQGRHCGNKRHEKRSCHAPFNAAATPLEIFRERNGFIGFFHDIGSIVFTENVKYGSNRFQVTQPCNISVVFQEILMQLSILFFIVAFDDNGISAFGAAADTGRHEFAYDNRGVHGIAVSDILCTFSVA